MKRILVWFLVLSFSLAAARAQDDATQQQINELNGRIQNLTDSQTVQAKRITALEKEIGELRNKSSQPGTTDTANADDLKKLADQVQEIDKKRQADRELILKEIGKLGKVGGSSPGRKPTPTVTTNSATGSSNPGGKENGYEYKVAAGDTPSILANSERRRVGE